MNNNTNRIDGEEIGAGWAIVRDEEAHEKAMKFARGCYQRAVLEGLEAMSGSTLRGKASSYGYHYGRSREALLTRIANAGIRIGVERIGRRDVLIIG